MEDLETQTDEVEEEDSDFISPDLGELFMTKRKRREEEWRWRERNWEEYIKRTEHKVIYVQFSHDM